MVLIIKEEQTEGNQFYHINLLTTIFLCIKEFGLFYLECTGR